MTDETLNLDEFRSPGALQRTNARRRRLNQERDSLSDTRKIQEKLERHLSAPRVETWPDAAAIAIYLLRIFAMTEEAQEQARRQLIAQTVEDLSRLSDVEENES